VRDGTEIIVRVHKPIHPPQDGSPLFVVYHGGGFCLGGLNDEQWLCRKWTELGGVAVNVDYRTTPEHPFPTPVNDAYDALKWVCCAFFLLEFQ
jgi:acetyl esterase/lipase